MAAPRVTIILPTWNGSAHLARLLPALAGQEFEGAFEIRAVDSDSSDDTRELLAAAGAHVTRITRAEFAHGRTRNLAARESKAELLVFLSQDVVPADAHFLTKLTASFADPRVAGAYARVLPHEDDDPLTARTVLDAPEASDVRYERDLDRIGPVWDMEPRERARYLHFNNVASSIRRSVFDKIPFPDVVFGEDFAWAARALTAGHRIAFVPEAVVHHAHRYSMAAAFERYRVDAAFHRTIHGYALRPTLVSVARGIVYEVREDARFIARSRARASRWHLLRSPFLRGAQVLGQYFGSRGWKVGSGPEATRRLR